jgi:hypothetical protein
LADAESESGLELQVRVVDLLEVLLVVLQVVDLEVLLVVGQEAVPEAFRGAFRGALLAVDDLEEVFRDAALHDLVESSEGYLRGHYHAG